MILATLSSWKDECMTEPIIVKALDEGCLIIFGSVKRFHLFVIKFHPRKLFKHENFLHFDWNLKIYQDCLDSITDNSNIRTRSPWQTFPCLFHAKTFPKIPHKTPPATMTFMFHVLYVNVPLKMFNILLLSESVWRTISCLVLTLFYPFAFTGLRDVNRRKVYYAWDWLYCPTLFLEPTPRPPKKEQK